MQPDPSQIACTLTQVQLILSQPTSCAFVHCIDALPCQQVPTFSSSGFSSLNGAMPSSIARNISSSIAMPLSASQPGKVWIGRPGGGPDDGYGYGYGPTGLGQEGLGLVSEHEESEGVGGAAAAAAGSGASSRRASSRQQSMRARGAGGAVTLPSLVAA